jgi:capsular polysaccharide biosynthesis protein
MSNDPRIRLALENWDAYVAQLATMPDKKLAQKLEVINMQAVIAQEKNIISSSELLEIWWRQVVEARTYKAENNIPDAPNEIELAIADIETFVSKSEERQEIMNDFSDPVKQSRPKVQQQDNDSQLSLF